MQVDLTNLSDTKVKLSTKADTEDLKELKQIVLNKLGSQVKVPGFREGTAPPAIVEKNIDQARLQSEFLDEALNQLYSHAIRTKKLRPASKPEVSIKKFVPFTTLEFEIEVSVVGNIKLANYKNIKLVKDKAKVTAKDVEDVINSLKLRVAEKKDVARAAAEKDEVLIDFKGVDAKGEPINGADGKDYPLLIGSKSFIPGFEENIKGMKQSEEKTFTLTFPKDYGVKALASKKVKFTVTVRKVQEVTEPKVDDAFAAKVGPFKTLKDLKEDIKKQLALEKQNELDRLFQNQLVTKITEKSMAAIPEGMITQQLEHNIEHIKRDLTYRGQTWQEFLKDEGTTEEKYRKEVLSPQAELQVKSSLVLSEIAEAEKLEVTQEELEVRMQILKGQYKDPQMQSELDKPESRQDIASRLLTEKVLAKLEEFTSKN